MSRLRSPHAIGFAFALALATAAPGQAATLRWANDGDANSMDPYTRQETFQIGRAHV